MELTTVATRLGAYAARLAARSWRLARVTWGSARLLFAVRQALPWWLRLLLCIGMVQVPFLPTDEICLAIAVTVILVRYRALARAVWHESAATVDGVAA